MNERFNEWIQIKQTKKNILNSFVHKQTKQYKTEFTGAAFWDHTNNNKNIMPMNK